MFFEWSIPDLILTEAKKQTNKQKTKKRKARHSLLGPRQLSNPTHCLLMPPTQLSRLLGYLLLCTACSRFPPPVERTGYITRPQNWMGLLNLGPNYPLKTFVLAGPGSGPVLPLRASVQNFSPAATLGHSHSLHSRSACGADRPPLLVPRSRTKGARTDAAITALGGGVPSNRRARELGHGT